MANSKSLRVARKHRARRRAAKRKAQEQQRTQGDAKQLPLLALKMLQRRLRVVSRGA
ncbi:MAG: hypothetical protein JSW67_03120 [Candidatus Latescibacterota bacterium]|nr:MAG: hypothetical protein JSW67_03120 [Candidatus Latescibacterota bacterium]